MPPLRRGEGFLLGFGLKTSQDGYSFELLKKVWLEAETVGFDSAWLYDHLYALRNRTEDCLECWTTISALAALTSRIRIGSLVLCNSFRHPALVAKMSATLDVISRGRLNLGIGAGWREEEYKAYGMSFPETRERIEQLEESLRILKTMWTQDESTFRGKHFTIEKATCNPKPIQKPHPPLWVGIMQGRRVMPKLAATLADAVNFTHNPPPECKKKIDLIDKQLKITGRSTEHFTKSWQGYVTIAETQNELEQTAAEIAGVRGISKDGLLLETKTKGAIVGTVEKCVQKLDDYIKAGVNYFILIFQTPNQLEAVKLFSREVMPAVSM